MLHQCVMEQSQTFHKYFSCCIFSNHSSETSSYTSDCGDQEEIDLAIKAAENATRQQVRARFESSSDMIHRLFVCISGEKSFYRTQGSIFIKHAILLLLGYSFRFTSLLPVYPFFFCSCGLLFQ